MPALVSPEITPVATPYEQFIKGMKGYLETSGARIQMLQGLEPKGENLTGREGIRFLGGICQQVDDLITDEYLSKGKDFPGDVEAIQELSGYKLNKTITEATEEVLSPWLNELDSLKPTIGGEIKLLGDEAQNYPVDQIDRGKIIFAVNLLIASQSEQVTMLPKNMRKIFAVLKGGVESVRHGIAEEQRRRVVDWQRPVAGEHVEHPKTGERYDWKGVSRQTAEIVLSIAVALGLIFGSSEVFTNQKIQEFFADLPRLAERAPGAIGDAATEKARIDRYEKYQNKYKTIIENKTWPERVEAENILTYLDPKTGYNEWKAIVEFCSPQCFVDPAWSPGEGRRVMMDFFGVDEAGLQDLYNHPEKIPDQLRTMYPDKPWLWELFSITPTPLNGEGESDFEKWQDKYKTSLGPTPLSGLGRVRIANDIHAFRRNEFIGQRQGFMNRGRGFGTSKGV